MADRQVALKAMIAAMNSVSKIQQEQNKLKANLLENSEKYRNQFMYDMQVQKAKGEQDLANKQAMLPLEIEAEQKKKNIMNPSEQLDYNIKKQYYDQNSPAPEAATTPSSVSGQAQPAGAIGNTAAQPSAKPATLPFGGDVNKFADSMAPRMRNGKVVLDRATPEEVLGFLNKKKEVMPESLTEDDKAKIAGLNKSIYKVEQFADAEGLSEETKINARALARDIYGVRGAEKGLSGIYSELRSGKTINQIRDSLRHAGQSKEFTGPVRAATQSILSSANEHITKNAMDYIDDLVQQGDTEGVKNQLKQLARKQAGTEESKAINGKERTIKLLDEIQSDLNTLEKNGVNTNIFAGTTEQIAARLGTVANPELRKLANKILTGIQNYRRSMTGVAFSVPESNEYKTMFPGINKTANFNSANIAGLKESLNGDLENFYALSMGEDNYNKLFKATATPGAGAETKKYIQTGIDKTSKRKIGMLADGTLEYIQDDSSKASSTPSPDKASGTPVPPISGENAPEYTAINPKTGQKIIWRNNKWSAI